MTRPHVTRSGIGQGVFTIVKTPDLIYSQDNKNWPTGGWVSGIIAHDSFHLDQSKRRLPFNGENGAEREKEANAFAAEVGSAIGLDKWIIDEFKYRSVNPGTRHKEEMEIKKPGGASDKPPTRKKP